jgi:hypothetical protein
MDTAQGKAARGRMRRENHHGGTRTGTRARTLNGEAGNAATAASPASPLDSTTQIKASCLLPLRYLRNHERLHAQRAPPSSGRATDR